MIGNPCFSKCEGAKGGGATVKSLLDCVWLKLFDAFVLSGRYKEALPFHDLSRCFNRVGWFIGYAYFLIRRITAHPVDVHDHVFIYLLHTAVEVLHVPSVFLEIFHPFFFIFYVSYEMTGRKACMALIFRTWLWL